MSVVLGSIMGALGVFIIGALTIFLTPTVMLYHDEIKSLINRWVLTKFTTSFIRFRKETGIKDIAEFFWKQRTIDTSQTIDLFFYPWASHDKLPIMDWFYMEYIKYLHLRGNKINKLIIFLAIDKPGVNTSNIQKVFNHSKVSAYKISCQFVYAYDFAYNGLNDYDKLIEHLRYIDSDDYLDFMRTFRDVKVISPSDSLLYRSTRRGIHGIFGNVHKGWSVIQYFDKVVLPSLSDYNTTLTIATILWEWDFDRLGIMHKEFNNPSRKRPTVDFHVFRGKTQGLISMLGLFVLGIKTCNFKLKDIDRKYKEWQSICIFDTIEETMEKAVNFIPSALRQCNSLLKSVLSQYEKLVDATLIEQGQSEWYRYAEKDTTIKKLHFHAPRKDFFLFVGLIKKVRELYE